MYKYFNIFQYYESLPRGCLLAYHSQHIGNLDLFCAFIEIQFINFNCLNFANTNTVILKYVGKIIYKSTKFIFVYPKIYFYLDHLCKKKYYHLLLFLQYTKSIILILLFYSKIDLCIWVLDNNSYLFTYLINEINFTYYHYFISNVIILSMM